jgi:hypothetical protein
MKLFIPKQHGAWAMLIIPFWLGVVAAGFMWQHIPFFVGWLLLYLATYPMLLLFKGKKIPFYTKWTLIYLIPALVFLMIPLWTRPSIIIFGFMMLPLFFINGYFSKKNNDRALINDLSAILAFGVAGLASSFLTDGHLNASSILVFFASGLFFIGCTFYVKTMIRERKNVTYKRVSWIYHIVTPIGWAVAGFPVVAAAFIPSLFRAIYFYGKPMSMKKVGVLEIGNAALFFIIMVIAII